MWVLGLEPASSGRAFSAITAEPALWSHLLDFYPHGILACSPGRDPLLLLAVGDVGSLGTLLTAFKARSAEIGSFVLFAVLCFFLKPVLQQSGSRAMLSLDSLRPDLETKNVLFPQNEV